MQRGDWIIWAFAAAGAWALFAILCRAILRSPRRGDPDAGLYFWAAAIYARLFHRLHIHGREHIPPGGPLIVVANHTGGIDPLLLQIALHTREIRWMMAHDMMIPSLRTLWQWMRIIPVVRSGGGRGDSGAAREAMRHLKDGGVLGVFPEGGIERPPGVLRPFAPGVGLMAAKSGAPVLPIAITGTPYAPTAWGSFTRRGRASLTILPPIRYPPKGMSPDDIAADLQQRLADATGWPTAAAENDKAT